SRGVRGLTKQRVTHVTDTSNAQKEKIEEKYKNLPEQDKVIGRTIGGALGSVAPMVLTAAANPLIAYNALYGAAGGGAAADAIASGA
ncbi:MAG: hypothetical protein RR413_11830, partial [Christensenellaceae bacterium]